MSGQDSQVSRLFRNVFGGEGVQANVSNLARSFQEGTKKGPQGDLMGCTWSGLSALYDSLNAGQEYCIKDRRFRVLKKLGEGGYAFVYLVRESGPGSSDLSKQPSSPGTTPPSSLSPPLLISSLRPSLALPPLSSLSCPFLPPILLSCHWANTLRACCAFCAGILQTTARARTR